MLKEQNRLQQVAKQESLACIPFREYFRRVILELKHGRTDYARSALPLATNGTQEPASDDYRAKKILINHKI